MVHDQHLFFQYQSRCVLHLVCLLSVRGRIVTMTLVVKILTNTRPQRTHIPELNRPRCQISVMGFRERESLVGVPYWSIMSRRHRLSFKAKFLPFSFFRSVALFTIECYTIHFRFSNQCPETQPKLRNGEKNMIMRSKLYHILSKLDHIKNANVFRR